MLLSYNLSAIEHFPTRTQNQSSTVIDNIFIDVNTFINYTVFPLHNRLAHHDAQLLIIKEVNLQLQSQNIHIRKINIL
jgi:hypothetical protein